MENPISFLLLISFLSIFFTKTIADVVTFNVLKLGANPNGKTDSTKAFLTAWESACGSSKPATIYVPRGKYLIKQAHFKGKCKNKAIIFRIDGTLVAPSNYNMIGNAKNWLLFHGVDGVSIHGGSLDGQGSGLWACKASSKPLGFSNSNNIAITGLTSLNSQMFHIVINWCKNVKLQAIKVLATGKSPNTDGIHVQLSSEISILNSRISTGDDCVSIGPGTTNLRIQNIFCGPGHGISIGSLAKDFEEAGVQNVTDRSIIYLYLRTQQMV
ncbi:hypothetical protein K7X08_027421 [Anisodus acutangulus]|uniref:Polygalacturonase n=1 Tax=Anisodus acutangulus TaxID=402998 RepID=A0A9Q1MM40_9SOLA|nr:hypothetical protein K7X08_027421 [Anisodus acutangulus]